MFSISDTILIYDSAYLTNLLDFFYPNETKEQKKQLKYKMTKMTKMTEIIENIEIWEKIYSDAVNEYGLKSGES